MKEKKEEKEPETEEEQSEIKPNKNKDRPILEKPKSYKEISVVVDNIKIWG